MNKNNNTMDDDAIEIDLRDIFSMLLHRAWLIALVAVVCGALAFVGTYFFVTPMYTASASLYVSNGENQSNTITTSDLSASQSLVDTYIVVLQSDTLLDKVREGLPYEYTTDDLRDMFSASAINNTQAFNINITNEDPEVAREIVNTIAEVAPDEIIRVVKAGAVEVIDYAKLPTKADWPLKKYTAIGLLAGLVLSAAGIILYNMMDVKIRGSEDLTKHYEVPLLGIIPTMTPAELAEMKRTKDVCA